jgi:ankyrin repeat protein
MGDVDQVTALLLAGYDPNIFFGNNTSLIYSAENNRTDFVEMLLEAGADPNLRELSFNETALFKASFKGFKAVADVLVSHGADVTLQIKNNETCLMWACFKGHTDIAELFIPYGADLNAQDSKFRFSPLMVAARNGHVETVTMLLRAGADTTLLDSRGRKAIDIAKSQGADAVIKILDEFSSTSGNHVEL